jgi:hypothetical protein
MKFFKKILIIIGVILIIPVVLCVIALFTKKDFVVEREIIINKPKQEIFNYIKLLKNQDNYSKWMSMDPNAKKTYSGADGAPGFVVTWESTNKELGSGSQTINRISEGDSLVVDLHFIKPFDSKATGYMTTTDAGGKTKVKWGMKGKMPYPFNVMMLFMNMDKAGGDDLATGLANLKALMEK